MNDLFDKLKKQFATKIDSAVLEHNEIALTVKPEFLTTVCLMLRDGSDFHFNFLADIAGIDYLEYGKADWQTDSATATGFSRGVQDAIEIDDSNSKQPRFAAVYQLLSIKHNARVRLRCFAKGEPPILDSVIDIWPAANWFEREAFDLFGIIFNGHPDLRRILTDYGFIGHPFRKDFPLSGHVEVRYDEEKRRVVYEPVEIEPRILVPKVIRHDHRYQEPMSEETLGEKR